MTEALDFERQLDEWFAGEAPGRAPERILTTALERVGTTGQRGPIWTRLRTGIVRAGWRQAVVLALVVVATVLAAVLVAGALRRDPPPAIHDPDLVVLREGHIVVIAKDGMERELGVLTDETLGSDVRLIISAMVSPDGHLLVNRIKDDQTAGLIIFDLRHLDARPMEPDVQGFRYGFAPNGTLGIVTNDGIATVDPPSGRSRSTMLPGAAGNPVHRPLTPDGLLTWAMDGRAIIAETGRLMIDTEGKVTTPTLGRLDFDGTFTAGTVPAYDDGIRTRRIGPDGEVLRCRREADIACYFLPGELFAVTAEYAPSIWTNPDPTMRLVDFSWATDGGLWLLLETAATGPRSVSLVHVSPTLESRTIASFPAEGWDGDRGAYVASAYFEAIAPDDSRLVVAINEPSVRRVPYIIDPSNGRTTRIDLEIAGWSQPGVLP